MRIRGKEPRKKKKLPCRALTPHYQVQQYATPNQTWEHRTSSESHIPHRVCFLAEGQNYPFLFFSAFPRLRKNTYAPHLRSKQPPNERLQPAAAMTSTVRGVGTKRPRGYVASAEEPPLPWAGRVPKPAMDADSFVDYGSGFLRKSCDR